MSKKKNEEKVRVRSKNVLSQISHTLYALNAYLGYYLEALNDDNKPAA